VADAVIEAKSWPYRRVYHIGSFREFGSLIDLCGYGIGAEAIPCTEEKSDEKATVLALAFVLALSVVPVMAASHTGTITVMHYNPNAPGRGVCVRTDPTGPVTGWFCL
jgi:hypothetical protein